MSAIYHDVAVIGRPEWGIPLARLGAVRRTQRDAMIAVPAAAHDGAIETVAFVAGATTAAVNAVPEVAIVTDRAGKSPYFFAHVCRHKVVRGGASARLYRDNRIAEDYAVEYDVDGEWVAAADLRAGAPTRCRVLFPELGGRLDVQYVTTSGAVAGEVVSAKPVLAPRADFTIVDGVIALTTYRPRVWVRELAYPDPIILGSGGRGHWPISVAFGSYTGGLRLTGFGMTGAGIDSWGFPVRRAVRLRPSIDGIMLRVPLTPMVVGNESRTYSAPDGYGPETDHPLVIAGLPRGVSVRAIDETQGIVYLTGDPGAGDVTVDYDYGMRSALLTHPQITPRDLGGRTTSWEIGIVAGTGIVYAPRTDATWYRASDAAELVAGSPVSLGIVSIAAPDDGIVIPCPEIGGGLHPRADLSDKPEAVYYLDIGYDDGPPMAGSKLLDVLIPGTTRTAIANAIATLHRAAPVDDAFARVDALIRERVALVVPAGAEFQIIYTEEP